MAKTKAKMSGVVPGTPDSSGDGIWAANPGNTAGTALANRKLARLRGKKAAARSTAAKKTAKSATGKRPVAKKKVVVVVVPKKKTVVVVGRKLR